MVTPSDASKHRPRTTVPVFSLRRRCMASNLGPVAQDNADSLPYIQIRQYSVDGATQGAHMQIKCQQAGPLLIASIIAIVFSFHAGASTSQSYPDKPVRILVPLSAGSQTDMLARMIAPKLSEAWRQPVIVDN